MELRSLYINVSQDSVQRVNPCLTVYVIKGVNMPVLNLNMNAGQDKTAVSPYGQRI